MLVDTFFKYLLILKIEYLYFIKLWYEFLKYLLILKIVYVYLVTIERKNFEFSRNGLKTLLIKT